MPSSQDNSSKQAETSLSHHTTKPQWTLDKILQIPAKDSPTRKANSITVINEFKLKLTIIAPKTDGISPRNKFAPLLSLLIAKIPSPTLEDWDNNAKDQYQHITTGHDLPYVKEQPDKRDSAVLAHLQQYHIFMNTMNICARKVKV
eukprot:5878632-Ditylum_brightwellii.AAC.1